LQTRESRADTLAQGEMWAGNPVAYVRQVEIAAHLTPDEVMRAARTYLTPGRIVISMIPAGKRQLISKPELPFAMLAPLPPKAGAAP
jgi:hypothetical protein